jgi:crotonobetainyl-CoA:carnitine CoA-transferase CaiB-like acyl-CoA transferase
VDKLTGHMLASMIGMALFHRERTGQGQEVHVPMLETTLSFLLVEHLWWGTLGEAERGVGYPRMLTPHRRPYPTKDGFISVIASSDAQYARLLAALGRPELIDDPRFTSIAARATNVDAVLAVLTEGLQARTTDEWLAILTQADIPCGKANSLSDLFDDDYLRETGFFQEALHPVEGRVTLPAIAPAFSASPPAVRRLWPTLGEHTREVLREAGLDDREIDEITAGEA